MQRINRQSAVTEQEMKKLEQQLAQDGYVQVDQTAKLAPKQYQISSHTGDADSFGGDKKYNINWCTE